MQGQFEMIKKIIFTCFIILIASVFAFADEMFPKKEWTDEPNPLVSPYAEQGGGISVFEGQ